MAAVATPGASDDLELALALADAADEMTLSRFRAQDLVVETKPDLTPVSEADRAVERMVRERLAQQRPDDGVLGEEYGDDGDGSLGRRWIIDPIDGTKSYVRGTPHWATLLALEHEGEVSIGVISAPAVQRRWWAARGAGAFTRDPLSEAPRRLQVSGVRELSDAQLCFGGLEDWRSAGLMDALLELGSRCWRTRGYGDFWNYTLIAEGAAEIGCDPQVSHWDLAAPMLIVEEAGGRFTDLSGNATPTGGSGVATNGLVHEEVLALIGR
ncbi:MAG: histidinol-phosphatase [Solirubrobacteraceae bacterium]